MKHLAGVLIAIIWKLGGWGLLILGILDSSFLFAPLGNDLLVVAMTAHSRSVLAMLYYAFMASAGSVLGCLLMDVVFRRAGEQGLEKYLSSHRFAYVREKVRRTGAWALALASIAPPPFPFTPFIMTAATLQYPRHKMLIVVGLARMVRFTALGVLALRFGRSITRTARSPIVEWAIAGLVILFIAGSTISVINWIKRHRAGRGSAPAAT